MKNNRDCFQEVRGGVSPSCRLRLPQRPLSVSLPRHPSRRRIACFLPGAVVRDATETPLEAVRRREEGNRGI